MDDGLDLVKFSQDLVDIDRWLSKVGERNMRLGLAVPLWETYGGISSSCKFASPGAEIASEDGSCAVPKQTIPHALQSRVSSITFSGKSHTCLRNSKTHFHSMSVCDHVGGKGTL